jgi:hypothetical protein
VPIFEGAVVNSVHIYMMILFTHSFFVFKIVTETNKSTYLFNYYFFFCIRRKR